MPPITGRVLENIPFREILNPGFGTELIYSFVIIVCSLMIYFGTKELYDLSSYKGIKYFRQAFLFFAIAYFFRYSIKFILSYFDLRAILDFYPRVFGRTVGSFTLFLFIYFSSMAIFYLLYSIMYKRWNENKIYLFHIIALVIAGLSILLRTRLIYFLLNICLFISVIVIVYISYKDSKKKFNEHHLYTIYLLLSFFWILNIIDILIPEFFQVFQLLIYLASLFVFLLILYKVIKKTG